MKFCSFLNTVAAVFLLCSALFCGVFAHFASAEVVHAYRKPNESDLQWLLGNDAESMLSSADIIQVGFVAPSNIKSAGECTLTPYCEPCKPVNSLKRPIPPAPKVISSKTTGIAPDEDGVINIAPTVIDSIAPVVQMSGKQLPPPSEVPKEQNVDVHLAASVAERLPKPCDKEHFLETPQYSIINSVHDFNGATHCSGNSEEFSCSDCSKENSLCTCVTCIICGDHRKNKQHSHSKGCALLDDEEWAVNLYHEKCKTNSNVFYVPDMIGSSAWFSGYWVRTGSSQQFALPTMLLTRPNVVEHFNAKVQNRIWADYRHWNNAVSIGNTSRGVDLFSFGLEKRILKRSSIELRVPLIYQFESDGGAETSAELGNVSVFLKQVLRQKSRWTLSGGVGVMLPTAEDWRPNSSDRLKNNAYYLVSFLGLQWHPNENIFGHFVVQADLPVEKNELVFSGSGSSCNVEGQQVIRTGIQLGRWIYRNEQGKRTCRLGGFAEVNYAVVTDGTPEYESTGTTYVSAFDSRKSTLTAAAGMPMVFGKLTAINSVILPISGSDRPFSVGYNFSLTRQF